MSSFKLLIEKKRYKPREKRVSVFGGNCAVDYDVVKSMVQRYCDMNSFARILRFVIAVK